ncbi:hypothetical protein [Stella sp.]|uniref:O-linked N-acetylglucosamine transferase, SPINDLY family protein n=1 Tax=Stella sp. TaxID=2912054 RepID=UPI0035B13E27
MIGATEAARALRSGRLADAERAARRSLADEGEDAMAHWVLATVCRRTAQWAPAADHLEAALRLDPRFLPALQDLGALRMRFGDAEGALSVYRAAVDAAPTKIGARQGMLVAMHYCASVGAAELAEAHRAAGALFPDRAPRPARRPRAGGPIRVGFVSADFRRHATLSFLPPMLRALDRGRIEVTLYSVVRQPDAGTALFRGLADRWVDADPLDDDALATRVAADRIDLLIDLNGHTAGNRLGLFARRPAPVQATWLDYVHSTGLAQIDWFLTDGDHVPPEEDGRHVERPLRLAPGTFCFDPPGDAPEPHRRPGPFTFGSFNALEKVGPAALAAWAEILREAPGSRLLVSAAALDRAPARNRVLGTLAAAGADPARVELLGRTDRDGMLERYGAIDLHLDSFPYSGGLTTLEALWMGVPTLTFRGDRIAGRHSASHLRRAGLARFVARDPADYIRQAVAFARDPAPLAALRPALRERVADSSLVDGASQARAFADLATAIA